MSNIICELYNKDNTFKQIPNVVEFFKKHNLYLSYIENFKIIDYVSNHWKFDRKQWFENEYKDIFKSSGITNYSFDDHPFRPQVMVKKLHDNMLNDSLKALMVLRKTHNGSWEITKGYKKCIWCILNNIKTHPCILIDSNTYDQKINSDNELEQILQLFNPIDLMTEKFYCRIDFYDDTPSIHFLEKQNFHNDFINLNDYNSLINNNYYNDSSFICKLENVSSFEQIELMHIKNSKNPNYFCTYYSQNNDTLPIGYLLFCSYNLFQNSRVKIAYTGDLNKFRTNDIIIRYNVDYGDYYRAPYF